MSQSTSHKPDKSPLLSDGAYNILKHVATIYLPAVATLYFALAQIWGLPHAEEVVGTIAAVNTFLGALIGLSTMSYVNSGAKYDGAIEVTEDPADGSKMFSLNLNGDPENLGEKREVTFKVSDTGSNPIVRK